jgi:hypothetical protein
VQGKWDEEHPVQEIELQLSGLKFTEDVKTTLDLSDEMPPAQRRLVETVITLPGTTLEEEFRRRNAAIDAVAAYCRFEEGGSVRGRKPASKASLLPPLDADPQVMAAIAEEQALSAAMLSVFTETSHMLRLPRAEESPVQKTRVCICESQRSNQALQTEAFVPNQRRAEARV